MLKYTDNKARYSHNKLFKEVRIWFLWFKNNCPGNGETFVRRVLCKVLGLTIKNRIYNFKLFLFFNIILLKTNTFIPAMLQRHYPVPLVVLRKSCKIPLYNCNCLLIRRKTLTSEEEFKFWEEIEGRGSQIWGIGWMFQQFILQIP